jgi:chromosome partitioning protein
VALSFWNARGKSNHTFIEVIEGAFPGKTLEAKIRRDSAVHEASIYGRPVFETAPKSRAAEDYRTLAEELLARL